MRSESERPTGLLECGHRHQGQRTFDINRAMCMPGFTHVRKCMRPMRLCTRLPLHNCIAWGTWWSWKGGYIHGNLGMSSAGCRQARESGRRRKVCGPMRLCTRLPQRCMGNMGGMQRVRFHAPNAPLHKAASALHGEHGGHAAGAWEAWRVDTALCSVLVSHTLRCMGGLAGPVLCSGVPY